MEAQAMIIGERLRALREEKKFSHGEVEKRTGLLRCYISRVENGLVRVYVLDTIGDYLYSLRARDKGMAFPWIAKDDKNAVGRTNCVHLCTAKY